MDTKRVIRALEVWYETGETISAHNAATRLLPPRYTALQHGAELRKPRRPLCAH